MLAVRLSDREKNDNSIPSKETVPRIFWKRVSNMRQSSCGHRTETVSAAAGESRMSCRPGSGRMCGTLMRTQRFLYSMIQKITTRQSVLHLGKRRSAKKSAVFGESHKTARFFARFLSYGLCQHTCRCALRHERQANAALTRANQQLCAARAD